MFNAVLAKGQNATEEDNTESVNDIIKHKEALLMKIKFMSKMAKMNKTLRDERENIIKIKKMNNDTIP